MEPKKTGLSEISSDDDTPEISDELKEYFEDDVFEDMEDDDDETDTPPNDKKESEDGEEEEEDTDTERGRFDGFDEDEDKKSDQDSSVHPLVREMMEMSPDDYAKIAKENPAKAMEMTVLSVLHKHQIGSMGTDELMDATRQVSTIQDSRRVIAERFRPDKNEKLRERARAIYKEKGFNTKINPQAELDAFILAAQEDPSLVSTTPEIRNEPSTPRRKHARVATERLTRKDAQIARRMGVDLSDPKSARRLAKLKAEYKRRRRQ